MPEQRNLFGPEVERGPAKRRASEEPVYNRVLSCRGCDLSVRRWPVPYRGPFPCKVAIIGEAPGQQEDARGGPFLGPAGQLLQEQLRLHKVIPERLFYMNVLSCFPPNKPPLRKHIAACNGNAWAQIELAQPEWAVLVGGVAMEAMAPWVLWGIKPKRITEMRGLVWVFKGIHWTSIIHPAAALREAKYRSLFESDIRKLVLQLKNGPEYEENCFICGSEVYEYDVTGMPFCKAHQRNIEFGEKRGHLESQADC